MKPSRKTKKASHLGRNIIILAFVVIIAIAIGLSLSQPSPQYFITVHVYDAPTEYTSFETLPLSALVANVTLTVTGPNNFGPDTTPTGILSIPTQIPSGTYTLKAEKVGYETRTITYVVGQNCSGGQILPGNEITCHALIRIIKTT